MAKKKVKETKEEKIKREEAMRRRSSFQSFFPIVAVKDCCITDNEGNNYPVLKIGTKNLDLISVDEKTALASQMQEVYSSMTTSVKSFQFSIIPMPYDISEWNNNMADVIESIAIQRSNLDSRKINKENEWEREQLRNQRLAYDSRLELMRDERLWVTQKVQSGRLSTKKCFLILEFKGDIRGSGKDSSKIKELTNKASQIRNRFSQMDVDCELANEKDLRALLNVLCNPLLSSSREVKDIRISPSLL